MRLGVKAAPGDAGRMVQLEGAGFLETVLMGEHLEDEAYQATREAFGPFDVGVVHAPFTVPGGKEVDVADPDASHREKSLRMWRASCRLARDLDARWVVLHPGGIAPAGLEGTADEGKARAKALERTREALAVLAREEGHDRLLVENMPAHYHRANGQTDLMLTGLGVMDYLGWKDHVAGLCLDTAHAVLTPGRSTTLEVFVRRLQEEIRHVHLADAAPPDQEGLQLGEGIVPWGLLARWLFVPAVEEGRALSAVPEVRGGHEKDGAGFQKALDFTRDRLVATKGPRG